MLQAWRITPDYIIFYFLPLSMMLIFFTLNWEEYHTGTLRTTLKGIPLGVTEMQWITMFWLIIPAIFGDACIKYTVRDFLGNFGIKLTELLVPD